jgi:ABC-2 type transport system permease protein
VTAAAAAEFARIGFVNMLAFRLRYYTGIITYFINVTVYYFIWQAIFAAAPGLGGLNFPQMVTYVAVGWIIRSMYFNNIDAEIASDVLEGKIVMAMIKPASIQSSMVARVAGEALFRLLMLSIPSCIVIALVFPLQAPASPGHFMLFCVSVAGSVLLVAYLNFAVGCLALRLKSILGLLRAKFWMQDLLSGVLVPLSMFPAPLRDASRWLPFEHIGYTPMMIYLGRLSLVDSLLALALQSGWILLLALFGRWFWEFMSRKVTVHGG